MGKRLFKSIFFHKVEDLQTKTDSCIDLVLWVLPNILGQVFCLMTASAKSHFLGCVDFTSQRLCSILVMFWLSFNIFRANTVSRLWTAISGIPRQLIYLLMIRQAISPKCCEIRHCAKSVRIWSYFVSIFPHSDKNNSGYEHFLRSKKHSPSSLL